MAKITYGTKAPFQNNPDIPKENKCTADDLNEIKNVVNQNDDDLETAKANIEELQNGQGTSESNITSLKNRISALETDNTNNKSNITNLQNNKVDKIEGKGLSTEDFTTGLKTKLEGLQNYDDREIKEDIEEIKTEQTEQNEEIDLIANMVPTLETEETEELNVKSSKYHGKLDLKGNTWRENAETLSPKNPSKIHNVEGNVGINICNKNVANLDIKEAQHNVTTEKVTTNIFKVTRTADTKSSYGQISMNLKANKTYTIYVKISGTNTDGAFIVAWKGYNGSGIYKDNITNYATIQATQELLVLGLYPNQTENLAGLETIFEIMIVEGNRTNESFIEHEEQEITFPLEEGQKLYKGSYPGQENIHHVRKQVEFDGTEDWILEEDENYFDYVYSVNFPDCKIGWQKSICTHFKNVNGSYAVNIGKVGYYSDYTNTRKYFCTDKATLQKWKEWLAEQKQAGKPVTVEYELEQEETEEMTEQQKEVCKQLQKIMTYYPETNVTNNKKALMKLTYKMNLNDAIVALQKLSIG